MATTHNSSNFQPAFKRFAQQGRHDDTFAVIAMLTNKPMAAIFRQAEGLGLPKIGPFHARIDRGMVAKLPAANGLVATVWKECNSYKDLPEVAIIMVYHDADWEVGRCMLFHRSTSGDGKTAQPCVVDPYPHVDSKLHLRVGKRSDVGSNGLARHQMIQVQMGGRVSATGACGHEASPKKSEQDGARQGP